MQNSMQGFNAFSSILMLDSMQDLMHGGFNAGF